MTDLALRLEYLRGFLLAYMLIEYFSAAVMLLGYASLPRQLFLLPIALVLAAAAAATAAHRALSRRRLRTARILVLAAGVLGITYPSTLPALYLVYVALRGRRWLNPEK